MKKLDREYRTDPEKTKLMNKAALELNITTATFNCKYTGLFNIIMILKQMFVYEKQLKWISNLVTITLCLN